MPLKTLLAAFILAAVPALAQAQCAGDGHASGAAISCADGTAWDPVAMTCVATASS